MSSARYSHLATVALAGLGVALWSYGADRLGADGGMRFKPNPLGLKMSAYGQVIGMAMQGPIDLFWHEGEAHDQDHDHSGCDHEHGICDHDHGSEPVASAADTCTECGGHFDRHAAECPDRTAVAVTANSPLRRRVKDRLRAIGTAANHRTNPRANNLAHKFYLRRQVENRLRMAYEFDPSNYGTYNAYHLFLTESSLSTTREGLDRALRLSELTIDYCLRETHDPRPALTAAAAAHDMLAAMFREPESFPREHFNRALATIDASLARHLQIVHMRENEGTIDLISDIRRAEMAERFRFVVKLREADEATMRRLFGQPATQQAGNTARHSES